MNQPADTNDLPVRVRRAAWLARAAFLLVFAINVQCAASFVLWPDAYAPSFEVAGVPGAAAVQGLGIAFLMWNATYPAVIASPLLNAARVGSLRRFIGSSRRRAI